jgi:hypothetical protein
MGGFALTRLQIDHVRSNQSSLRAKDFATEISRLREHVAKALYFKGVTRGQQDRNEEAVDAYDEVVRRFGDASEPGIRK